MLVVYLRDDEIIVMPKEKEKSLLGEFFADKTNRDINTYERRELRYASFSPSIRLEWFAK